MLRGSVRDFRVAAALAVTVPIAFAVMVVVSLLTPQRMAPNVAHSMVRLHVPEAVEPR